MPYNNPITNIINGKEISETIKTEVAEEVKALVKKGITPGLTVVIVGEDPASQTYVASKEKSSKAVGMRSNVIRLPATAGEAEVLTCIDKLNKDKKDRFIKAEHVKQGAVVIDVGINRVDGKLYGDVDYDSVAPAMLLANTLKATRVQSGLIKPSVSRG